MRRPRPALAAALLLGALPAAAQETPEAEPPPAAPPGLQGPPSLPEKLAEAPGTWDLSRDGTNRRCVLTLSLDNGDAGRRLHFPAGCRRALPVLNGVAAWLYTEGAVRLVDRNVRPVLSFARRPDQRSLLAKLADGESYSLVPLDIAAMRPPPTAPEPAEAAAGAAEAPPALRTAPTLPAELTRTQPASQTPASQTPASETPAAEAAATEPPDAAAKDAAPPGLAPPPGIFALDRSRERDTCRLDFEPAGGAVRLEPGCRDSGIETFDPVRWAYAGGRITLTAKRGHSIALVPAGGGRWRRDPEVGATLVLRKVGP